MLASPPPWYLSLYDCASVYARRQATQQRMGRHKCMRKTWTGPTTPAMERPGRAAASACLDKETVFFSVLQILDVDVERCIGGQRADLLHRSRLLLRGRAGLLVDLVEHKVEAVHACPCSEG